MANNYFSLVALLVISVPLWQRSLAQQDADTTAQCAPVLLPLAPCGAFVQGGEEAPAQMCCDGLHQTYAQQPQCLCLLLGDLSALGMFPAINTTLALQLPDLCSLNADVSVCSAGANGTVSPGSQVSLGSTGTNSTTPNNSTVITGSPVLQTVPRPSSNATAHVLETNGASNFQTQGVFTVSIAVLIELFYLVI